MLTSKRDQCVPPSAVEGERLSFIGRKMCVEAEKSGRADFRVRGSGVWFRRKVMEGRRRVMWDWG